MEISGRRTFPINLTDVLQKMAQLWTPKVSTASQVKEEKNAPAVNNELRSRGVIYSSTLSVIGVGITIRRVG